MQEFKISKEDSGQTLIKYLNREVKEEISEESDEEKKSA